LITLYQRTDCPFCWKVRLALCELDLPFTVLDSQLGEPHPDVIRLSPKKTVPVLVDDGQVIWESAVIVEYLQDRYGEADPLSPGNAAEKAAEKAKTRLLHSYSDTLLGPGLRKLVFEKRSRPEREWSAEQIADGQAAFKVCLSILETQLVKPPPEDEILSSADCALAARFGVAEAYGAGVDENFPALLSWFTAIKDRPSWQRAYPDSFIRN
jgi:glutathione S-transferase